MEKRKQKSIKKNKANVDSFRKLTRDLDGININISCETAYFHFLECPNYKSNLHHLHAPNFISFLLEPFKKETYIRPKNINRGKTIFIRWKVSNEIDKRYKESNSRLVTWSNGSRSIVIGDQVFDIEESILASNRNYLFVGI